MNRAALELPPPASSPETGRGPWREWVVPEHLTSPATGRGPRVGDHVWDLSRFTPRAQRMARLNFATYPSPAAAALAKEYLHSRLIRAVTVHGASTAARPMKLTSAYTEFNHLRLVLQALHGRGVRRLDQATQADLDALMRDWTATCAPITLADRVGLFAKLAGHSPFLTTDRLTFTPWPGRHANHIAGHRPSEENLTPRIPEQILAPLLRAAVFYVQTAATDLQAAQRELGTLAAAPPPAGSPRVDIRASLDGFFARRRAQGRGLPALPLALRDRFPHAPVVDGVVQAPNQSLTWLMAGVRSAAPYRDLLLAAGDELGYETGGLDTALSPWPDTGQPWRPRLDAYSLIAERHHLRTACWIVIAYLSGMRDVEVRELARDCASTTPGQDGRLRHKLRGKVFKDRHLTGEDADWVVLDIVHQAVHVLTDINDDPIQLFGYHGKVLSDPAPRINVFRNHVNALFSTGGEPFIPYDGDRPWQFTTRQFRRTLAWHIAHQPFGVVAGARQYKHAKITMFEGYAGTSASGFAAEVAAEEAVALLDYVEDLYRDWNEGARAGGGADARIDAEFDRIRSDLGDLPGAVADPARLRTMLRHLTQTLHPGVLNDCFFNPTTAVCVKRATILDRPAPQLTACLRCPNARRSSIHLPRLTAARDQARQLDDVCRRDAARIPPLQRQAIRAHLADLDQLIAELAQETPA